MFYTRFIKKVSINTFINVEHKMYKLGKMRQDSKMTLVVVFVTTGFRKKNNINICFPSYTCSPGLT